MNENSSSIERKVIMVNKYIPTAFKKVNALIVTDYNFIDGKYIPKNFKETTRYIPTEFEKIKIPIKVTI